MVSHQSIRTAISKMFKFVVVLAFVAAAVAEPEPGVLLSAPYVQPYAAYSTVVSPASTSISSQSSSVIHPSPITYSSPLAFSHFIKKRSADPQFLTTTYGFPYNYQYTPSAAVISTPTVYRTPIASLPVAAHLIKKRQVPLLTTPYIAPTTYFGNPAVSPVISTPYLQTPYLQTPYYGAELPLVSTHLIKKRSAEPTPEPSADPQTFFPSTYLAPSTYINTVSPYLANPVVSSYSYYPTASAIPLATAHLIKKRSAEASPEPAAAPAADPQLAFGAYPTTFYAGSPLIPTYPAAAVIKSAPWTGTGYPFVYSTFIKK